MKQNMMILLVIVPIVLIILWLLYKRRENLCLCNGPQIEQDYTDRTRSQVLYNSGNTELASQSSPGQLVMPYDVVPTQSNYYPM